MSFDMSVYPIQIQRMVRNKPVKIILRVNMVIYILDFDRLVKLHGLLTGGSSNQ